MDSDWHDGVFLGLRTVSCEYLVGAKEGVFLPRTVRKVPVEKRWADNLSFVIGVPWKHNSTRGRRGGYARCGTSGPFVYTGVLTSASKNAGRAVSEEYPTVLCNEA